MSWISVYDTLTHHQKLINLAETLGVHQKQVLGHLVALWLWAYGHVPDGNLTRSRVNSVVLALAAGWDDDPEVFVAELLYHGFLDQDEHGDIVIHDWADYAGKFLKRKEKNKQRMKQKRARERDEASPVVAQAGPAKTKAKSRYTPVGTTLDPDQQLRFNQFWEQYPRKVGRGDAEKAWKSVVVDDALADRVIAAIHKQLAYFGGTMSFIPFPATWLRARRWEDDVEALRRGERDDYRERSEGPIELPKRLNPQH